MIYLLIFIFFVLIFEFYLRKLIDRGQKKIQWILTNNSETSGSGLTGHIVRWYASSNGGKIFANAEL